MSAPDAPPLLKVTLNSTLSVAGISLSITIKYKVRMYLQNCLKLLSESELAAALVSFN